MQKQLLGATQLGFSLSHLARDLNAAGLFVAEGRIFAVQDKAVPLYQIPRLAEAGRLSNDTEYATITGYLDTRKPLLPTPIHPWLETEKASPIREYSPGLVGLFIHKFITGGIDGNFAGPLRGFAPRLSPFSPTPFVSTPATAANDPELMTVLADIASALGAAFCFVSEGTLRSLKLTPIDMKTLQGSGIEGELLTPLLKALNNTFFSAVSPKLPAAIPQRSNAERLQKAISQALNGQDPQLNDQLYLAIVKGEQPVSPADLHLIPEDIAAASSESIAICIRQNTIDEREHEFHIPLRFQSDGWACDLKRELSPTVLTQIALLIEKFGCSLMPYKPMLPQGHGYEENDKTIRTNSNRLREEINRYTHSPQRVRRLLDSRLIKEVLFLEVSGFAFSTRVANAIQNANIKYVGELIHRWDETPKPRNFGKKSQQEIIDVMAKAGIPLPPKAEHLAVWEEIIHPRAAKS